MQKSFKHLCKMHMCCSFKETLLSPYPIGENSLDNKNKQYCCIVL